MQDSERARALLESTALLEFYLVKEVTTTNDLMIKIDQSLKGNEVVAKVSKLNGRIRRVIGNSFNTSTKTKKPPTSIFV